MTIKDRRTTKDWVYFIQHLVDFHFPDAECIRVVLDNLSTHKPAAFYEFFELAEARRLLDKLEFHFTPATEAGSIWRRSCSMRWNSSVSYRQTASKYHGIPDFTCRRLSIQQGHIDRSHGAVWNCTHTLSETQADPRQLGRHRVAVDETQIEVDGEEKWLYATIDTDSKLLLEIEVFSRRGTDSTAAFLNRLTEKHAGVDTEFLVDAFDSVRALARGQPQSTGKSRQNCRKAQSRLHFYTHSTVYETNAWSGAMCPTQSDTDDLQTG